MNRFNFGKSLVWHFCTFTTFPGRFDQLILSFIDRCSLASRCVITALMLQLKNVIKQYADQVVLGDVDWHVRSTDRVGLCGENGAGKTTLLRLLAGQCEADAGKVQLARGTTVGYLPQEGLEHSGRDLFNEVRSALDLLLSVEEELQSLEKKISRETVQADLDRYSELQEIFRQRGGYTMEADIGRVLKGLGFKMLIHGMCASQQLIEILKSDIACNG